MGPAKPRWAKVASEALEARGEDFRQITQLAGVVLTQMATAI